MQPDSIPVLWGSSRVSRNKTIFSALNKEIVVEAPGLVMRQIIDLCDGSRNIAEVIAEASKEWDEEAVIGLLKDLYRERAIVNGKNLIEGFWSTVTNPMLFPVNANAEMIASLVAQGVERHRSEIFGEKYRPSLGDLTSLIAHRKSTRIFSGEKVSFQALIDMLWSAYAECKTEDGRSHRTVPSPGALYPLMIHVCLFKQIGNIEPGIYKVCYDQFGSVGFEFVSADNLKFLRALIDPINIQRGAHGVIVVSGNFSLSNQKYGNRSLLYVTIEAGHVAQNVLLTATQHDVSTLEIGGFTDALLANSIGLAEDYHPLTLIAFGKEGKESLPNNIPLPEIDWATPLAKNYESGVAFASVRLSPERSWSYGRDPSPEVALKKAMSEAKEWTSCGCVPDLIHARPGELDGAIDPREIIQFHQGQYRIKGFPFTPFSESVRYGWTKGYDLEGEEFFILADHVYFPYFSDTPYYCYSNSSGCAAHPNKQTAIQTATLELVERDAFMNTYLCRLDMPIVSPDTFPDNLRKRVQKLRAVGFDVWFVDHSLDLAPVVFAFVQSKDLSFTACSSCSSFDAEYAAEHAFTEVEAVALHSLQSGPSKKISPSEVAWPEDHGRLYTQRSHFRRADFLVGSQRTISFQKIGNDVAKSWEALIDRFRKNGWQHLLVPLTLSENYGGNDNLHIVRAIVPGMTQLTFGYRQEPAGMKRIYEVSERFGRARMSYGELTKFPHPFE